MGKTKKIVLAIMLCMAGIMAQAQDKCYETMQNFYSMCANETGRLWHGSLMVSDSVYRDTVAGPVGGCDTIYESKLTIHPLPAVRLNGVSEICEGDSTTLTGSGARSYRWNGPEKKGAMSATIVVHTAGQYIVYGTDEYRCNANDTIQVIVHKVYNTDSVVSSCSAEPVDFYGTACNVSDEYLHTLKSVDNCDSVIHLKLTVEQSPELVVDGERRLCIDDTLKLTAQGGDTYAWSTGDSTAECKITEGGSYTVEATNANGCSVSETLTIKAYPTYHENQYGEICYGETFTFYGREETRQGDHIYTTPTKDGCDSNVTLHLTVKPLVTFDTSIYVRDTFTWNEVGYNESGLYMQRFKAASGCDSTVVVKLTVIYDHPLPKLILCDERLLMIDHYAAGDSMRYDYAAYRWYCNGKLIKKSTGDSYHAKNYGKLSGCYHVEVATDATLEEWVPSDTICVNYAGIEDIATSKMTIHPNPASSGESLQMTSSLCGTVRIYDMQGRCVYSCPKEAESLTVAAQWHKGIYTVVLTTREGQQYSNRIVIGK